MTYLVIPPTKKKERKNKTKQKTKNKTKQNNKTKQKKKKIPLNTYHAHHYP